MDATRPPVGLACKGAPHGSFTTIFGIPTPFTLQGNTAQHADTGNIKTPNQPRLPAANGLIEILHHRLGKIARLMPDATATHDTPRIALVIPARGGSKGIPRKNLRTLNGVPLIAYTIRTALASIHGPLVVVSTDDDEIAVIAEKEGAQVHRRSSDLAVDATTLDPVIYDAIVNLEEQLGSRSDLVVTVQPTSPLLATKSLDAALSRMLEDPTIDTTISATNDTHLSWRREDDRFVPNYEKRVNRQYLPPTYRETGGFLICRRDVLTETSRIGPNVQLYELEMPESIDIDSHADWGIATHYLRRKRFLFVVTGHRKVGMGHVYNSLLIANDLAHHAVEFLVDDQSQLAFDAISLRNYPVRMQSSPNLADDVNRLAPDVVVNDHLDTSVEYMRAITQPGRKLINVEDLGPGARMADLVVNALYPDAEIGAKTRAEFGPEVATLRDEFILTTPAEPRSRVERVLLTFGGTDPSGLTAKVLDSVQAWCEANGIAVDIVTGLGFDATDSLTMGPNVTLHKDVRAISTLMNEADIAFTSAGRTLFELASLGTPAIVLAQNERELTHTFASEENGFVHLGLGAQVSGDEVLAALVDLVTNTDRRLDLRERMLSVDLRQGRRNVARLVEEIATQS